LGWKAKVGFYHEGMYLSLPFWNYQDILCCVHKTLVLSTILLLNLDCKFVLPSIPPQSPIHNATICFTGVLATTLQASFHFLKFTQHIGTTPIMEIFHCNSPIATFPNGWTHQEPRKTKFGVKKSPQHV
jgi:hypothetical protein